MQNGMPGSIGRCAGPLGGPFTEMRCHTAKWTLVNLAVLRAGERNTIMLQLNDRWYCLAAHIFNRILVTQPIRPLDRIVHMPAPVILTHISQCRRHTTLCCDGVTASR